MSGVSLIRTLNVFLLVLLLGVALKVSCGEQGWGPGATHPYCYSDIPPLYEGRGLAEGRIPYLQAPNEYPVGTAMVMLAAAWPAQSRAGFFAANVVLLGAWAAVIVVLLHRTVGSGALFFAAAPSLVLYAFLNWDLVPVALATAGTVAYLRRRERSSGLLLGLGAAAKLYPALFVLPFALGRAREGRRRESLQVLLAGAATVAAVNLPFVLFAFDGWMRFFRFTSERPPTWGTLWSVGCRAVWGGEWCPHVGAINVLSLLLFLAVAVLVWRWCETRSEDFPRWTLGFPLLVVFLLTTKVYSPQYSLWLLPWFALVLPQVRLFVAFQLADVLIFLTEFSAQGARFGLDPFPRWALDVAVVFRAVVLVACLLAFVERLAVAGARDQLPKALATGR